MFNRKSILWSCIALVHCNSIFISAIAQTEEQWVEDPRNGCKVFNASQYANETITYEGKCKNGYANGKGTVTWYKDEKVIEIGKGFWKNGKLNGNGSYDFSDGTKYVGEWINGKKTGKGNFTWPNGNTYVGEFNEDKRTGNGYYIFADGKKYPARIVENLNEIKQSAPPSSGYGNSIRMRVKPNITFDPSKAVGNPRAEVKVITDSNGKIINRILIKPSGDTAWDTAVLKAIDKTGVLPKDVDGRVFSPLLLVFMPND